MSTELATQYGDEYGDEYAGVVEDWANKLEGVDTVTDKMQEEWGSDLHKALGPTIATGLLSYANRNWQKAIPADLSVVKMFISLAVKAYLAKQMYDLLTRLHSRVNNHDEACALTAACPERLSETLKRVSQTTAQIFDMVKDGFDQLMLRFHMRKGNLTGNRRWVTVSSGPKTTSRHADLDGQVKKNGEEFSFEKSKIFGPRPPGGHPDHWSNCSCYLQYETKKGKWI